MKNKGRSIRERLQPLERLDLSKHHTVAGLVLDGMRRCSLGARMLGNVAATLCEWCGEEPRPTIIYDGPDGEVFNILKSWEHRGWVESVLTSSSFVEAGCLCHNLVVVGECTARYLTALTENSVNQIFINQSGQTKPGHYRDGYFPNMVVSDPAFIIPVLDAVLREKLKGVSCQTVGELLRGMAPIGLAGQVQQAVDTLRQMIEDPDTTVCLTLSGAMTPAKMGLLIDDMISLGMVDLVSSTGALMAHGLIEGVGLKHYVYDPKFSDHVLLREHLNRITDGLEPEENFTHIDEIIHRVLLGFDGKRPIAPSQFHAAIGRFLARHYPKERAILASAYRRRIPVLVPAMVDSEIGNDVLVHNLWRRQKHRRGLIINQELDSLLLVKTVVSARRLGIVSIGGGVPRNNTQNVAPLIDIINGRLKLGLPRRMFCYGLRIDPTPLFYGNLSGCTYSEGGSWGKFDLSGLLTEVQAEATIVWPFILKAVLETFKGREKPRQRRSRSVLAQAR